MDFSARFSPEQKEQPFASYQEYTEYLFACVNRQLGRYIEGLMRVFAAENGGFKNVHSRCDWCFYGRGCRG